MTNEKYKALYTIKNSTFKVFVLSGLTIAIIFTAFFLIDRTKTAAADRPPTESESAIADLKQNEIFTSLERTFVQRQKLTASDGAAGDQFGAAVAISGNTAVVGATADTPSASGFGSAYVFVRSGTAWIFQQELTANDAAIDDQFGSFVAIDGDTIAVTSPADDVGSNSSQGSTYVYVRTGTVWTQQQKLTASNGAVSDVFGRNVSIAGNTLVVGAPGRNVGANPDQGSAYVFVRSGTIWSEQQILTAADGSQNDFFGDSSAIEGDTVIIGAAEESTGVNTQQGSAYVFVRSGTTWTQQQKLTANDGAIFDFFGSSVALSGDTAVIGTQQDVGANFQQGSAYIFVRSGTSWTQQQKLLASDGGILDSFGNSVAIDGDTAIIGAFGDTTGANPGQGAAYNFTRTGTTWTQMQKLTADDGSADDNFGSSVAISSTTVIVGSLADTIGTNVQQGSAYIFNVNVTLSGIVTTPGGLTLRNASVTLTDSAGVRRTMETSPFGVYSFTNVSAGDTYIIGVSSKRFRFASRTIFIDSNLTNINFTGLE